MMKHEFESLAGYEVSWEDYNNLIEPMYMVTNLPKQDFIRCLDRKRFEVKRVKTQEQLDFENRLTSEIQLLINERSRYKEMLKVEEDLAVRKYYRGEIKSISNQIDRIKFVLGKNF